MISIPLALAEAVFGAPFLSRPHLLASEVSECPSDAEMRRGILFIEKRDGHLKWAHLKCPKCGDHIQLPLAGSDRWAVRLDLLRRPTVIPSIWERAGCGAHFIVRRGGLLWCEPELYFPHQRQ